MPLDKQLADDILKTISLGGAASEENMQQRQIVLGSRNNLGHILNLSSGLPKIHNSIIKRFSLILSRPVILEAMHQAEIRCCLCKQVISYPCWYYNLKYTINSMHYFVCFDETNSSKPTARCYKRDI